MEKQLGPKPGAVSSESDMFPSVKADCPQVPAGKKRAHTEVPAASLTLWQGLAWPRISKTALSLASSFYSMTL